MTSDLKQFKARALARPGVRRAYEALGMEFALLDEALKTKGASDPARIGLPAHRQRD